MCFNFNSPNNKVESTQSKKNPEGLIFRLSFTGTTYAQQYTIVLNQEGFDTD